MPNGSFNRANPVCVNRRAASRAALFAAAPAAVLFSAFSAGATEWRLGLQDAASPVMERLVDFHTLLLTVVAVITAFVTALLLYVAMRFSARNNPSPSRTTHNTALEVVWTVVPAVILIVVAVPSFRVLYYLETTPEAEMTVKITGRQWYWDYEYPDHGGIAFSAFMIPDAELKPGQKRLLETDNRLVLPVNAVIRLQVTAGDVIHSWALPAFGVKKDAVPGRLNETWVRIEREGVYYGQCSEICGTNHGFMPIAVEAVSREKFAEWVQRAKTAYGRSGADDVASLPPR